MKLSVVIINWNTRDLLLQCLEAVYRTIREISFEVWLVDNGSGDQSVAAVREQYPQVEIIANARNLGFAAANNQALRKMRGEYGLLLNTDAVLTEGAVAGLLAFLDANPEAGMACGQLLNADGSKQNSVANFPKPATLVCNETLLRLLRPGKYPSKRREYRVPIEVESCIGACLLVRRTAMEEVGLLDERYFFFMEETDWALRMNIAGWKSWFIPQARIYHLQGRSAGPGLRARILFYRSRYAYFRKWHRAAWPLTYALVSFRLLVNVTLNFLGIVLTLGRVQSIRQRLVVYAGLLGWHLRGCPEK